MPRLTLLVCLFVASGVWLAMDAGGVDAQVAPQVVCDVTTAEEKEVPQGELIAAGTKVRVKCFLSVSDEHSPLMAKSELVGRLRWSLTDTGGTHDLVGNPVDLSQYRGELVLTVEGVAPQKRVMQHVTETSAADYDKVPFQAEASPNESRRLISFGQGNPFDGIHIERTVAHRWSISVTRSIDALGEGNSPQSLMGLAQEMVEAGRPWEAQALVDALNTMDKTPWWASVWAQRTYGFFVGIVATALIGVVVIGLRQLNT